MIWLLVIALAAPGDHAAFEDQILAELEALDPSAVEPFRRADRERDAGNLEQAANAYNEVIAKVPEFDHAHRRLCQVRAELGRRRSSLDACRRAIELRESADNYATLAMALVDAGRAETSYAIDEAMQAARRAAALGPGSVPAQTVLCHVGAMARDLGALRACTARLLELAPDDQLTHTFAAILAIAEERWDDARASLERARELGMPQDVYDEMDATLRAGEPAWRRWLARWWWLAAGVLVVLAGVALWWRYGARKNGGPSPRR